MTFVLYVPGVVGSNSTRYVLSWLSINFTGTDTPSAVVSVTATSPEWQTSYTLTRKLSYRKDDHAMRPIYGCPENFRESLSTPTATFPNIFRVAFVPIDPMNVHTKFEVLSFTRSWDNMGYPKNLGSPWICPCLQNFLWPFTQSEPANVPAKFEVHTFKRSRDNWKHHINFGSPCIRPRSVFSIIFNGLLFPFGLWRAKVLD